MESSLLVKALRFLPEKLLVLMVNPTGKDLDEVTVKVQNFVKQKTNQAVELEVKCYFEIDEKISAEHVIRKERSAIQR